MERSPSANGHPSFCARRSGENSKEYSKADLDKPAKKSRELLQDDKEIFDQTDLDSIDLSNETVQSFFPGECLSDDSIDIFFAPSDNPSSEMQRQ